MANIFIIAGLFGGIGGFARSTVGLLKAMSQRRKIIWQYWLMTVLMAVVIGIFAGMLFSFDLRVSLLAGYAGTDVIEGLYKSLKKRFGIK